MDYLSPASLMDEIEAAGTKKVRLRPRVMVLKGFLSGALLAYATALAFKVSDGFSGGAAALVAGLVFPVGFAMIVLLGMELITGNFAVLPVALFRGSIGLRDLARNWSWVALGNLMGSVFVSLLLAITMTEMFSQSPGPLGAKFIAVAQSKTHVYAHAGVRGWLTAFTKGLLCNWMVAMGTVLGMSSNSTWGKIAATWLPISTFFALALEHSVVNLFVIPTAILLGADITFGEWWWWNQIPVTLGNLVGGAVLTGLLLHWVHPAEPHGVGKVV